MRMDRPSVSAIEGRASEDPNEVFAPRRRLSCGVSTKNPLHRPLAVQTALKDGRIALYGCAFDGKPEGWQTAIHPNPAGNHFAAIPFPPHPAVLHKVSRCCERILDFVGTVYWNTESTLDLDRVCPF